MSTSLCCARGLLHPAHHRHPPYVLLSSHNTCSCSQQNTSIVAQSVSQTGLHARILVYNKESNALEVQLYKSADCEDYIIFLLFLFLTHKYIWTLTLFGNVICFSVRPSRQDCWVALHIQNHTHILSLALTHPLAHTRQISFSAAAAGFASYFLRYWFLAWHRALLFPRHYAHSAQNRAEDSQHCLWTGDCICCT